MKKVFFISIFLTISSSSYSDWKGPFSLKEVYYGSELSKKYSKDRISSVLSSSGMSWSDGRQANVLMIEVKQGKTKWLFRCTEFFDKDMVSTGNTCYELAN